MPDSIDGAEFQNEDWYGEDLGDRRYQRCRFAGVDLTEASSHGAVFEECTFINVRFNASRHTDTAFLRCQFTRCVLFDAEFTGCKMIGSTVHETTLRPLRVIGGDWSFTGLRECDLRGVTIDRVRMREADLTGADCTGAVLTNVDLSGAQLARVRFARCDLRGSDLTALDPTTVDLSGAVIDAAQAIVIAQLLGLQVR
jgi:fluoroquinolone resistance protein